MLATATPPGKIKYSRYQHSNYSTHLGYDWNWGSVFAGYDYFEGVINVPNNGARAMILDPWRRETFKAGMEFNNFSDILLKVKLNGFYQNNLKKQIMSMYIENDMDSYGGTLQTDWLFFDDHYVIFGADWNYDDLDTVTRSGARNLPADGQQSNLGIFLQDEWSVLEQLKIIGGVRYTYVKTEADDWRLGKNDTNDDSWVGNFGVVYMPTADLALRANVSQGYKVPNLSQQYIGNFMGTLLPNHDLDPEKSTNYEVGLRYNTGAWNVDAALYYADAKDFISSVTINASQSQYINLDKAQTLGFELGVDYTFEALGLTPYAVFNWMRRETTNTVSGIKIKTTKSGYPEFTGQLGVKWQRDLFDNHTFFADLNYFWNGNTKDKYYSSTYRRIQEDKARSFGTLNLNLGFESHHDDCINYFGSLGLRNLFDKEYRLGHTSGLEAPGFHAVATFGVTF